MGTEADPRRFPLALAIACPACAGGFVLVVGALLGATALAVKGALVAAAATLVAGLWARNIWRRRHEG